MSLRLTLVIHSLQGGGAEKTMALMANRWAEMGHTVAMITLDSVASDDYPLTADVVRVGLDRMSVSRSKWEALFRNVTRIRELRRAIADARGDYVVSFTEKMNVLVLIACRKIDTRVIACERTDPRHHPIGKTWSFLRRRMYQYSHAIVVQTNPIRDFVRPFAPRVPIHVVPNCIWSNSLVDDLSPCRDRSKTIVAMGRLVPSKGFDILIQAFGQIASKHRDWSLAILGDGPAKAELQSQVSGLELEGRVKLLGWATEPASLLCQSQVFVMSSRYEGFPNALLEAMALGLAPISFDCESGPREIIRHEVDGLLVPTQDVNALADALERLLSNDDERVRLAERALEVRERFSEAKFFSTWDRILEIDESREQGT